MTICNSCQQTIPETLSYRTAPKPEPKQSIKSKIKIDWKKYMSKTKSLITLPVGLIMMIGIPWIVFPGIYHLGYWMHNNILHWEFISGPGEIDGITHSQKIIVNSWFTGILTLISPIVFYYLLKLGNHIGTSTLNSLNQFVKNTNKQP